MAQPKTRHNLIYALAFCGSMHASATELDEAKRAVRLNDFTLAAHHYEVAADRGNTEAQYQLASLYALGKGLRQNDKKAEALLKAAAAQGYAPAQFRLGSLLIDREPEQAKQLLQQAAAQDYKSATAFLEMHARKTNSVVEVDSGEWFGAARNNKVNTLKRLSKNPDMLNKVDSVGRNALFYAIESGQHQSALWLIAKGIKTDISDQSGATPIQNAIERGQTAVLNKLLKSPINLQQTMPNGDNLLHFSIRRAQPQYAPALIAAGIDVNHQNHEGWTPGDLAEYYGRAATLTKIKAAGGGTTGGVNKKLAPQDLGAITEQLHTDNVNKAMLAAVSNNNAPLVRKLAAQHQHLLNDPIEQGSTLLDLAVKQNKKNMIKLLIALGSHPDHPNSNGDRPLHSAVRQNDAELVALLLDAGARPTLPNNANIDAIVLAMMERRHQMVEQLVRHITGDNLRVKHIRSSLASFKAPVNDYILYSAKYESNIALEKLSPFASRPSSKDAQGRNAMWYAANHANAKQIARLITIGVSVTQTDELGRTPLIVAVDKGCLECSRLLLSQSDINHQTLSGNTALILAATNGNTLLINWLLQNNASIDLRNNRGETPLMMAVNSGSLEATKILVDGGASVTRINKLGFSSIDLARLVSPQMEKVVKGKAVLGIF